MEGRVAWWGGDGNAPLHTWNAAGDNIKVVVVLPEFGVFVIGENRWPLRSSLLRRSFKDILPQVIDR